jgi:FkbM family methyltransferase
MASKAAIRVYGVVRSLARRIGFSRRAFHALKRMENAWSQTADVRAQADETRARAIRERDEAESARVQAVHDREEAEKARWRAVRQWEQVEAARWEAVRRCEDLEKKQNEMNAGKQDESSKPVLSIPKFWERSYWEPTVQFALRDYCRAGDVVFDVGANAGALSMLMSRLVGPRGVVCAFEASPRIVAMTQQNLVSGGCSNVQLYHRAIYHTSHESVAIYAGSHLNDSIYPIGGPQGADSHKVETLALDDFVSSMKLVPKLIKMDIEGAEYDALQGMKRLLSDAKPVLVLEQSPSDMRCHELLSAQGYAGIDLATYRRIRSSADFEPGVSVANILYVHSSAKDDPYLNEASPETVAQIPPSAFRPSNGGYEIEKPVTLPAGRYICRADFSASGKDNEIFAGVEVDGEVVVRYHTYTSFMADSYRDWVFTLRKTSNVAPYLRFLRGADETLNWRGVNILRFAQFDRLAPQVID